jgi:hypothetical protein
VAEMPDHLRMLLTHEWRAQPDNTMGGWCVTLAEDPRAPADGALAIASFLTRTVATHIADVHNHSLRASDEGVPSGSGDAPGEHGG